MTQIVNRDEIKGFLLCNSKHFLAFGIVEEFAARVQELQGVPLLGIVACSKDDASGGFLAGNSYFGSGRRGKPYIYHIESHGTESGHHETRHHFAGQTGVTTNDYQPVFFCLGSAGNKCGVCSCEFYNVERREALAGSASDGTADT